MLLKRRNRLTDQAYSGNSWQQIVRVFILCVLVISVAIPQQFSSAQQVDAAQKAQEWLSTMSPEEKVGQLFLVTFDGTDFSAELQIYDLVVNHAIGGVILRVDHNNFNANTIPDAKSLIKGLQTIRADAISLQVELQNNLTSHCM